MKNVVGDLSGGNILIFSWRNWRKYCEAATMAEIRNRNLLPQK